MWRIVLSLDSKMFGVQNFPMAEHPLFLHLWQPKEHCDLWDLRVDNSPSWKVLFHRSNVLYPGKLQQIQPAPQPPWRPTFRGDSKKLWYFRSMLVFISWLATCQVQIGLDNFEILKIDDRDFTIEINAYFIVKWRDRRLQVNMSQIRKHFSDLEQAIWL